MDTNINNEKNEDFEIDIREVIGLLLDKIAVIILVSVIFAAAVFVGVKLFVAPTYQSEMDIYVKNNENTTQNQDIQSADLQASSYLTNDVKTMIVSNTVMERVIDELNLDMTMDQLKGKITVTTTDDSRIVNVAVQGDDPYETKKIVDKVVECASDSISTIVGTGVVSNIDSESRVGEQVGPNTKLYVILGFALGFILSIVFIILRYSFDDSIKTSEDVEKYLGLSVLGLIPEIDNGEDKKKKKKKVAR